MRLLSGRPADVVVVGHVGRDVVLRVAEVPDAGSTARVLERLEAPGGKGYNQALGLVQLGRRAALVGALGADGAGEWVRHCAMKDGLEISALAVRADTSTSLVVSAVDAHGTWRYLEDLPASTFVQSADVERATALIEAADAICLQLQEPFETVLLAARAAHGAGRLVVIDGAPQGASRPDDLYAISDVVRADQHEAQLMTGVSIDSAADALTAATAMVRRGPSVVVFAAGRDGNAVAWEGGEAVLPLGDDQPVDTTGAGDAFVAGLTAGLLGGHDPQRAACIAKSAADRVVGRLGGRPMLSRELLAAR